MIDGIKSAMSGLQAQAKRLGVTANNVANVESDGFKKGRTVLAETAGGGVTARVETVATPGPEVLEETAAGLVLVEKSNVDLTEEMPHMLLARRSFEANLKVIQTGDEMLGALLDLKT
ncbi:MAG: flagellar basal body rod C-terminal domain-containing protein [Thermodesulfobacteriota bacterium]